MAQVKKSVRVRSSKPHRNAAHEVKSYCMRKTKNVHRNKAHLRRARRTNAQIAADNAKAQLKAQKKAQGKKSKP